MQEIIPFGNISAHKYKDVQRSFLDVVEDLFNCIAEQKGKIPTEEAFKLFYDPIEKEARFLYGAAKEVMDAFGVMGWLESRRNWIYMLFDKAYSQIEGNLHRAVLRLEGSIYDSYLVCTIKCSCGESVQEKRAKLIGTANCVECKCGKTIAVTEQFAMENIKILSKLIEADNHLNSAASIMKSIQSLTKIEG